MSTKFPWLCNSIDLEENYTCYDDGTGSLVTTDEKTLFNNLTDEAYGKYGLKFTYYSVSLDYNKDRVYGEDTLQQILRAFYFNGYTESIPANVRTYKVEGIYGEDLLTVYVGIDSFQYWSTYGGEDRNTPEVYDSMEARIGDIVYLPTNDTFYEIRDVKYYNNAFGLSKHVYTLTLKVYKDVKYTISANPTIGYTDPIWEVATSALTAQYNTKDILSLNEFYKLDKKQEESVVMARDSEPYISGLISATNTYRMNPLYNQDYTDMLKLQELMEEFNNTATNINSAIPPVSSEIDNIGISSHSAKIFIDTKSSGISSQYYELKISADTLSAEIPPLSAKLNKYTYTKEIEDDPFNGF